jgi:hypothetical protein
MSNDCDISTSSGFDELVRSSGAFEKEVLSACPVTIAGGFAYVCFLCCSLKPAIVWRVSDSAKPFQAAPTRYNRGSISALKLV